MTSKAYKDIMLHFEDLNLIREITIRMGKRLKDVDFGELTKEERDKVAFNFVSAEDISLH